MNSQTENVGKSHGKIREAMVAAGGSQPNALPHSFF
jgi:hypothetical protein